MKMTDTVASRLALSLVLALAGACDRVPNGDGKTEQELERERVPIAREAISTPTAMAFNDAINTLVDARCGQEQRCNNIGDGKRYGSGSACQQQVRAGFSDDLVPAECPDAVDRRALAACVKEVGDEACGPPLDRLARLANCRTVALCGAH
ncbi:MAG: hypothetical protein JWM10_3597 [Myxococcaceae bacterium]|nr:hypothetical protein [Myxococcaceae bacterium]